MSTRKHKLGLPPGSLIHMGNNSGEIEIHVLDFNEEHYKEYQVREVTELCKCTEPGTVSWINVDGIHNPDLIKKIGEQFSLHPLVLEDVMNPYHRPKIEEFEHYIHFTLKMLAYNQQTDEIESEQVSFVLGDSWVISFQESPGDVFDPIRDRIRNMKGRVRQRGADYLVYALIDIIVDHYFLIIDVLDDDIEEFELEVLNDKNPNTIKIIQQFKKDLMFLRKAIIPVRDAVGNLQKGTSALIDPKTTVYFKDVFDHALYITESIEVYREMLNSLMEVHLSALSNRMNNVMKILTVISTIFIPLTFIVGVYGMNFEYMPELDWEYGYAMVWVVMLIVTGGLVYILRRNKWM